MPEYGPGVHPWETVSIGAAKLEGERCRARAIERVLQQAAEEKIRSIKMTTAVVAASKPNAGLDAANGGKAGLRVGSRSTGPALVW